MVSKRVCLSNGISTTCLSNGGIERTYELDQLTDERTDEWTDGPNDQMDPYPALKYHNLREPLHFGLGVNSAFEDVTILDECLTQHAGAGADGGGGGGGGWTAALPEFSTRRAEAEIRPFTPTTRIRSLEIRLNRVECK